MAGFKPAHHNLLFFLSASSSPSPLWLWHTTAGPHCGHLLWSMPSWLIGIQFSHAMKVTKCTLHRYLKNGIKGLEDFCFILGISLLPQNPKRSTTIYIPRTNTKIPHQSKHYESALLISSSNNPIYQRGPKARQNPCMTLISLISFPSPTLYQKPVHLSNFVSLSHWVFPLPISGLMISRLDDRFCQLAPFTPPVD